MPVKYHARRVAFGVVTAIALTLLNWSVAQAQGTNYTLGTIARLEGPGAGLDSVVLGVSPATGTWTATTNASWLHLSPVNQSGTGSTNVIFSYDANAGATRTGTLTIAGQAVTVTQAGSTYIPAQPLTKLVDSGWGENQEIGNGYGVAVDGAGNVYIADMAGAETSYRNCKVQEWVVSSNTLITFPIPSSPIYPPPGICYPQTVAVDGSGNLYIGDIGNGTVWKWTIADNTLTAVVGPGFYHGDIGVAVDGLGNVYTADSYYSALEEWIAASNTVTTLVSSGLNYDEGVALDAAGNVYIADSGDYAIKEWNAASHAVTTLVYPLYQPQGVAVDGSGNVYIANTQDDNVLEWIAASNTVTILTSSVGEDPVGVAVDGAGNVYIGTFDYDGDLLKLSYAFVDPTPRTESGTTGSDSLPTVLPASENLLPPSAPSSDQSWLTITGITNGVVSFSFTANTGPARTAHITLLGQSIPITQAAPVIGTPPRLTSLSTVGNGTFQFSFTNTPGANFTVRSTTNLALPLNKWTVAGNPVENPPGAYQFTSQPITNNPQIFFDVSSP